MKKILIIDKCQDCKYENYKYRQLAGSIPINCPLISYDKNLNNNDNILISVIEEQYKDILGIR